MTKQEKLDAIGSAYESKKVSDERKEIQIISEKCPQEVKEVIQLLQRGLEVSFEQSYDIMADACYILSEKTLTGRDRGDSLTGDDLDFMADADSNANVYTAVQLSYLNINNEAEISDLMKDESITSIAQACNAWYIQKVAEACEALKEYILQ